MVVRISLAISILGSLAGITLHNVMTGPASARDPVPHWSIAATAVLIAAAVGLGLGRWWGRWLGLAVGVMCTTVAPFALSAGLSGKPFPPAGYAFLAGPAILLLLSGRAMFRGYDARAWPDDGRTTLVRWAVITNVAALGGLLFANLILVRHLGDVFRMPAVGPSFAAMFAVLVGVMLLGRGKTLGLLILVAGAATAVVALSDLLTRPHGLGALVLTATVAPGVALALAAAGAYARPIWRFLRG